MKHTKVTHVLGLVVLLAVAAAPRGRAQETPPGQAAPPARPEYFAPEPALQALITRALEANPGLKEAELGYRAALEQVPQVTALPDPMVTFTQAIRSVETRVGPQDNAVMLSQAFPWFGKLDLKGQMAVKAAAAASDAYAAKQRDVIAQVKTAYYGLGYVDAAVGIAEEERSLLAHYERLAEDRYASGQGLQQAVIKIQAEITKIDNRLLMLREQRASLAARLNTLVDVSPEGPVPTVEPAAPPTALATSLQVGPLYALGEANRPEVKAADARVERDQRAVELAKKNYWPDIVLSAGFVNVGHRGDAAGMASPPPDNGKNALTVSVGVSVPIHRAKLKAAVRQALDQVAAGEQDRAALVNGIEEDVRDQVIALQTLADQIDLFDRVLIPQARETQRSTEAAYQTGQVGVLDLLDSERVLFDVRLANTKQQSDYLVALAKLERAVGTKFPQ